MEGDLDIDNEGNQVWNLVNEMHVMDQIDRNLGSFSVLESEFDDLDEMQQNVVKECHVGQKVS